MTSLFSRRVGGGHCVLKWILRRHFKPPLNATILISFEVVFIDFGVCFKEIGSKLQKPDIDDFKHYFLLLHLREA